MVPVLRHVGPGPKGTRVVRGWPGMWSSSDDNPSSPISMVAWGEVTGANRWVKSAATASLVSRIRSKNVPEARTREQARFSRLYDPKPTVRARARRQAVRDGGEAQHWLYGEDEKPDP